MEEEGDWCIIRTTALVPEEEEEGMRETAWPPEEIAPGEVLGISTKGLLNYERTLGDDFLTQFMVAPPYSRGDLFKWWNYHSPRPHPQEVTAVRQFWDTAFNETKRSAYSVMGTWLKLTDGRVYLDYVLREKMEMPRLLRATVEEYQKAESEFGQGNVLVKVEGKASGHSLVQMLRGVIPIDTQDIPKLALVDRAKLKSPYFESRHVLLPAEWRSWKEPYEKELRGFPRSKYRDQVAMTILALEYLYPEGARGRPVPWTEYAFVR
jgi:predicted phage terminase large subunit-like protein